MFEDPKLIFPPEKTISLRRFAHLIIRMRILARFKILLKMASNIGTSSSSIGLQTDASRKISDVWKYFTKTPD